jgi:hypothetical protein
MPIVSAMHFVVQAYGFSPTFLKSQISVMQSQLVLLSPHLTNSHVIVYHSLLHLFPIEQFGVLGRGYLGLGASMGSSGSWPHRMGPCRYGEANIR